MVYSCHGWDQVKIHYTPKSTVLSGEKLLYQHKHVGAPYFYQVEILEHLR